MKRMFFLMAIVMILAGMLSSCKKVPAENMAFPEEDCVMVYTISETEYIRILWDKNSAFCNYGEWIKGDTIQPVYLRERRIHATHGLAGYEVYIEEFNPDENDHVHTSECDHIYFEFEKGVLNSSCFIKPQTREKVPYTYSTENNLDFYFSWVSEDLIAFNNTCGKIYKENDLNFWYDFENQKGEWKTNGRTVPIRMEFYGITPFSVQLTVYDVSSDQEKQILSVWGELADENTLIVNLNSEDSYRFKNEMFYEGTVSSITISRMDRNIGN